MRKLLLIFSVIVLSFASSFSFAADPIPEPTLSPNANKYDPSHPENLEPDQLYAESAILITADTSEVIFDKDAYSVHFPASTTKIMTVLLGIIMVDDLYQTVTVSETALYDIDSDSSTMGLQVGEEIRYIDVLYGTILRSGNDGANVIAETVSGSIASFVDLMNNTASLFGCQNTHFMNPHGLHNDNHYTTAYDMALIAREAMKNDLFRQIAGTTSYTIARTNKQRKRTITTKTEYMLPGSEENPNKYFYPDATGIKTGSHSRSGYCFVGSASRNGVDLISVVFFTGRRARWADTIKLMDYGFSQYVSVTPLELYSMNPKTIETSGYSTSDTKRGKVQLICRAKNNEAQPVIVTTKAEAERLAANIQDILLFQYTRDFVAPITAGEIMGTVTYFTDKGVSAEYDLIASRSVAARDNAPKTLEQIVEETNADPNPFPPFSPEIALILLGPLFALFIIIVLLRLIFRHKRSRAPHVPHPVNRYLK